MDFIVGHLKFQKGLKTFSNALRKASFVQRQRQGVMAKGKRIICAQMYSVATTHGLYKRLSHGF